MNQTQFGYIWFLTLFIATALSLPAHSKDQCCECISATGPYKKPLPNGAGSSQFCPGACKPEGGDWNKKVSECNPSPYNGPGVGHPTPVEKTCLKSIDGGDCRGNNWCECAVALHHLTDGKIVNVDPKHVKVGEEVEVDLQQHFGGTVSGVLRSELASHGSLTWGDGESESFPIANRTMKHVYKNVGEYQIHVNLWGAYHWSSGEGSCSYECETNSVKNQGQIRSQFVVVEPAVAAAH